MDFTFTAEQYEFRDAIASFLSAEVTPERIRARWDSETGFDTGLWSGLSELGLSSMLVPEALGGLGLGALDFVMLAEECGRVALPEPIVVSALVATPLLVDALDVVENEQKLRLQGLLEKIASGEALVLAGHLINANINFADMADALLLPHGDEIHLIERGAFTLKHRKSLDPSRRVCEIDWSPSGDTCIARGRQGADIWRSSLNRGALGAAAQLLGLTDAMIKQAVRYSSEREQFGKAIGTNQAVKHLLADCAVRLEYAKPVVARAAYTCHVAPTRADCAVSHAKVAAAEASSMAARNCIQVFGAMGYTWECDLQIFAKRAWVLEKTWGDSGFHKNRIHEWLLNPRALIGAEFTFGSAAAGHGSQSLAPAVLEIVK